MTLLIETDRLSLRPVELGDFDKLTALWRNTDFTRYIVGRALTDEEIWFRLLRDLGHWNALGIGNWSVHNREDGAYVGSVGILNYRRAVQPSMEDPELGWGVNPAYQGQGMAREALRAVLQWADANLSAHRTICMIGPDNTPSIRLANAVGYRPWVQTEYGGKSVILYERARAQVD